MKKAVPEEKVPVPIPKKLKPLPPKGTFQSDNSPNIFVTCVLETCLTTLSAALCFYKMNCCSPDAYMSVFRVYLHCIHVVGFNALQ